MFEGKMAETSSSTTVSTKLEQIAKLARAMPQAALTTLAHHIDLDWLREAYRRTRKDGATGVDRQTADEYARNLEDNLRTLLERTQAGSYVAPTGPTGVHPEGRGWFANAAHRYPHLRGQGASAGGGHGAGSSVRAEFS
jgi:RNA-directed DNA polymerase